MVCLNLNTSGWISPIRIPQMYFKTENNLQSKVLKLMQEYQYESLCFQILGFDL